ncbi:MAG: universal stress protein [Candidatus Eremiobacteraeota bacterium]|nr:universal stress protein [Candidatus Eremiobacteraeota bacterium]MCW5871039.1 universal stress protein [Candidatus Eremiobacteraeota bacterium]
MFRKILVPLDGSEESERALEPARELARAFQAELRLVTVEEMPEEPVSGEWELTLGGFIERKRQETQENLNRLAETWRGESYSITTAVLPLGSPVTRIRAEARECKADLIVLFSHGRSGLSRVLLGSVAERLTRNAPCPVMIIHHQDWG